MGRRRHAVTAALAAVALGGCAAHGAAEPLDDGVLDVTATTTHVTDLVEAVGGDLVDVHALMGPGVDPHLYEPRHSDTRALLETDAVFYHGLFLEGRLEDLLEKAAVQTPTLAVTAALPRSALLPSADAADQYDPHVWFDPELWLLTVDPVVDRLAELMPAGRPTFEANAARYAAEIRDAHAYAAERLAGVPPTARVLVTSHDAFGYFGRAYGFDVRGLQGLSTEDEAGVGDLRTLADLLARERIPAVFTESSVPRRTVEAVRAAAADRGWEVTVPEEELYADAMGGAGTPAGTYPGMLRANADTIADALGGPDD